MESNKRNSGKDIKRFIIIIFIVIIVGFTYNYIRSCSIKKNIQLSVAKPVKFSGGRVNNAVHIKFYINNEIYETETLYHGLEPKIGQKYFIAFNKENIDQTVLFSNCPVPDSLEIPLKGWDKIPIPEYQDEVDAYFDKMLNKGIYKLFPKCE